MHAYGDAPAVYLILKLVSASPSVGEDARQGGLATAIGRRAVADGRDDVGEVPQCQLGRVSGSW